MSDIIVIGFDEPGQADSALTQVEDMATKGLLDVESAGVVVRDQDGNASYHSDDAVPGAGAGAALGGMWGLMIAALFAPFTAGASVAAGLLTAGGAMGAIAGAGAGAITKADFEDAFTNQIEVMMRPGTAALAVKVTAYHADTDELLHRLQPIRGKVLRTNLTPNAEAKLQHALSGSA